MTILSSGSSGQSDMLARRLAAAQVAVEATFEGVLQAAGRPHRLVASMRHAVFAGGKRMRPFLVIESARLFGVEGVAPLRVAAAIEAVHCYSLVHDDLPSMDNDDLRRGQPTVHRAFDEATAILAGDALLTLAFSLLAHKDAGPSAARREALIAALAEASGIDGMVGGQMLDLAAEGRFDDGADDLHTEAGITRLQALKTGALIRFSAMAGAYLARKVTASERRALRRYGEALGLAFQIKDDLLDATGDTALLGKAVAKDAQAGKATFVSLHGLAGAQARLDRATREGAAAIQATFGARAEALVALLAFNCDRDH